MRASARLVVLCVAAFAAIVGVQAALGGGSEPEVVAFSNWSADPLGFVVETTGGTITGAVPYAGTAGPAYIQAAADDTIVFIDASSGDQGPLWLVHPDGKAVELDSSSEDFEPTISPDGSRVAFVRFDPVSWASDIYVVNSDGSGLRLIAQGGGTNELTLPRFSPDGGSIAFWCGPAFHAAAVGAGCGPLMDGTNRPSGLMLMNADGSDKRMIVIGVGFDSRYAGPSSLSWSPDGQWLAMDQGPDEGIEVFAYRTDGSDLFNGFEPARQVTHDREQGLEPEFDSAGQILYLTFADDSGHDGNFWYLVNRDGTGRAEASLTPAPVTCVADVCSGFPFRGAVVPPATGGAPNATVNATLVTVPGVRALSYRAAKSRLQKAHLRVGKVRRRSSAHVRRGHVIGQFPRAGARAHRSSRRGPPVNLILSSGQEPPVAGASSGRTVSWASAPE